MRKPSGISKVNNEDGVSCLIEYLLITSVLLLLMIIMTLSIVPVFIEGPLNRLNYYTYNDVGNGVSTRIVDLYSVIPEQNREGYITRYSHTDVSVLSQFDIPGEIAGRGYYVEVVEEAPCMEFSSYQATRIVPDLSGIGETIGVIGKTSGSGLNEISYSY